MSAERDRTASCSFIDNQTTWRLFELPVAAHLLAAFRRHDGDRLADVIQVRQEDADE